MDLKGKDPTEDDRATRMLYDGVTKIHSIVGYVLDQPAGESKLIMRRLTKVELVICYQFQKVQSVGGATAYPGQLCKCTTTSFCLLLYVFLSLSCF